MSVALRPLKVRIGQEDSWSDAQRGSLPRHNVHALSKKAPINYGVTSIRVCILRWLYDERLAEVLRPSLCPTLRFCTPITRGNNWSYRYVHCPYLTPDIIDAAMESIVTGNCQPPRSAEEWLTIEITLGVQSPSRTTPTFQECFQRNCSKISRIQSFVKVGVKALPFTRIAFYISGYDILIVFKSTTLLYAWFQRTYLFHSDWGTSKTYLLNTPTTSSGDAKRCRRNLFWIYGNKKSIGCQNEAHQDILLLKESLVWGDM